MSPATQGSDEHYPIESNTDHRKTSLLKLLSFTLVRL